MSDEKMRAEFEEWYLRKHFEGDTQCGMEWLSTEPCGGYRHAEPSKQWKAWQASRAALAVELPPKISEFNTDENGFVNPAAAEHDEAIDDCRAAIEAAGVKVKP